MRLPALLILAVLVTLPFANGRWTVPIVAVLSPLLLLRLLRSVPGWRGLALGWLLFTLGWTIQWWDIINLPRTWFALAAIGCGTVGFLPYCADRFLVPRLHGIRATLVFPLAQIVFEFTLAQATPNGTWGALAYTQYGNLPLMQLASLTGIYGISFVVAWAAAVANFIWDHRQWPPAMLRAGATFVATILVVLGFGGVRLALTAPAEATLRVAALAPLTQHVPGTPSGPATIDDLLARSAGQAAGGAKAIVWSEDSFTVRKVDEPALLERVRQFARERQIHLGVAYGARLKDDEDRYENRFVLVSPEGAIAWEYLKNRPVPGREMARIVRGTSGLALHDAGAGLRFAGAICYDGDFPSLFHAAGRSGAGVLLLPAHDWRAINPIHANMAVYRAIEQGVSLVRPTLGGLSIATNALGQVLAASDDLGSADRVMVAEVPVRPLPTLYSRLGDWFAWLCALALFALGLSGFRWKR
jgi:apolipoprotein N-acyltransferase